MCMCSIHSMCIETQPEASAKTLDGKKFPMVLVFLRGGGWGEAVRYANPHLYNICRII